MKSQFQWICCSQETENRVVAFSKALSFSKPVKKVTASVTSMGIYALLLNGKRVGTEVLTPGWTSYSTRIQYQKYDLTELLEKKNDLSICVGQGWAVGAIGWKKGGRYYADHVSCAAVLTVEYTDGSKEEILTDESWKVSGFSRYSEGIYHGETVDLTATPVSFGKAIVDSTVKTKVIPAVGEPICEQERIAPVKLIHTPKGETVLDFGQNLTGYVEVNIKANRGERIVLHHGEVLDAEGNFYSANMRSARNENVYVCSGEEDSFKPWFSFQGFRYVQVVEHPNQQIDLANFTAIAVHSDMKRTGNFVCGNEKINQLYHNIVWGQKCNYLDIPTDCPQRDERLGWTGDAQVFCKTAAINYDISKFFHKWLGDMRIEQGKDGSVRGIVPACVNTRISAAWGDVACIAPWEMYTVYGDKAELRRNFPMMKKWVEYLHHTGPEEFLWLAGIHYGDWLAMDAGEDSYMGATSNDLIGSAFFAHSTELLIKAGKVLGEDMTEYEKLYQNVRKAFRSYFMENGFPKESFPQTEPKEKPFDTMRRGRTQTALVLILHFGLYEESEKKGLEDALERLIHENGDLMATGFVGTPYLLHVLSDAGKTDLAYKLLFEERSPSWLYSVNHGATTMWEHWNSLKEDGSFWSTDMNSFNHYAYGAVYDWIFGVAVGIQPSSPAYQTVSIRPHPDRRLGFADASIETKFGKIRTYWYYKEESVQYEIEIPVGCTADLTLPSGKAYRLSSGSYHFGEKT